ncbi:hypothetical protein HMPREF2944_00615 [Rothia sp. HMSC072E10]|nr:hypothetical protein HMPREF2944_00615 [Rothia sp. HMSC072E10]
MFDIFLSWEGHSVWLVWKVALAFISTGIDRGGHATYFLRAYAGAPVTQTLRPSSLRCGERLCDTLRALPENVAAPYAYWSKRAVLSTLLQGHPSSLRFGNPDVAYG